METRRLYITSRDSKPRTQFNDKVSIDFSKAHLGCESNQLLGIRSRSENNTSKRSRE